MQTAASKSSDRHLLKVREKPSSTVASVRLWRPNKQRSATNVILRLILLESVMSDMKPKSESPLEYLDSVLGLIQEHAYYGQTIDWARARAFLAR